MQGLNAVSEMRIAITISIALFSCSSRSSEDKINHEAIMLHNSMMKKANQIEHRLNGLWNDTTVNRDSLKLFSALFEQWRADIVEVAGNENHDHSDHAHSHSTIPDITEEQMLEIQRELDERLSKIGKRINRLKPDLINNHEH
jgi:hypothetical protein